MRPFFIMETEIKVNIVIIRSGPYYSAYAPDFPGIAASGGNKKEVIKKITRLLYRMAKKDREQYTFGLN